MSLNRAQRRKLQKKVGKKNMGIMDTIMAGAERKRAAEGDNKDIANKPMGLQLPDSQTIGTGVIVWRWSCLDEAVDVTAMLATADDPEHEIVNGQFIVQLAFNITPELVDSGSLFTFTPQEAEELGTTLVSARNWEFEWKKYAGDFLLKEMSGNLSPEALAVAKGEHELNTIIEPPDTTGIPIE